MTCSLNHQTGECNCGSSITFDDNDVMCDKTETIILTVDQNED